MHFDILTDRSMAEYENWPHPTVYTPWSSWNWQLHCCFPSLISVMYVTTHRCVDGLMYRLAPWPLTGSLVMPRHETTLLQYFRETLLLCRTIGFELATEGGVVNLYREHCAPHRLQTVLVIVMINTRYRSSGGEVVKFLACGARGPGFDSRSRYYDFRDWLSPAPSHDMAEGPLKQR